MQAPWQGNENSGWGLSGFFVVHGFEVWSGFWFVFKDLGSDLELAIFGAGGSRFKQVRTVPAELSQPEDPQQKGCLERQ